MLIYNLSDKLNNLVDESIEKYGCDVLPTDEEVWEIAKIQDELPIFENIYTYLFFLNLINHLPKKYTYDYYINGTLDSHLYYFDEKGDCYEITNLSDVLKEI